MIAITDVICSTFYAITCTFLSDQTNVDVCLEANESISISDENEHFKRLRRSRTLKFEEQTNKLRLNTTKQTKMILHKNEPFQSFSSILVISWLIICSLNVYERTK